jgi:hypothetical protein
MAKKSNNDQWVPDAPDLSETAQAIARGREIVEQSRRIGEEADRQIGEVQATLEQADRVLDRSHQLLGEEPDQEQSPA